MKTALLLSGGGARGAYQVGAMRALFELSRELKLERPFPILTGISAGAINCSYLAAHASKGYAAIEELCDFWSNLSSKKVFHTDIVSLSLNGLFWIKQFSIGRLSHQRTQASLLNTAPLQKIIEEEFPLGKIQENIDKGFLDGLAISAVDYSTGGGRTFFQAIPSVVPWTRMRRRGERTMIRPEHILASAAIPILFPAVKVGSSYMADGDLRNYAPLSPAIKLGAEKILVIGVKKRDFLPPAHAELLPSPARILSVILNSILLDVFDQDYERLYRINQTLKLLPPGTKTELRPVDVLMIHPSEDIGKMAAKKAHHLPLAIRHFVSGLGSKEEAADLISYILFEAPFIRDLMEMGYSDTKKEEEKIKEFLLHQGMPRDVPLMTDILNPRRTDG